MRPDGTKAEQQLMEELCHQINSPLAAIRNALYLSAARSRDPVLKRYLELANSEISSIAGILRRACTVLGEISSPRSKQPNRGGGEESRAAA